MNKSIIPLALLLLGWCLCGAWYLSCDECNLGSFKTAAVAPVESTTAFNIADRTFNTQSTQHFTFPNASAIPTIPAKAEASFDALAQYLKGHPNRQTTVEGFYTNSENNTTKFSNLGIARAESIKEKLIALGAPADNVFTKGTQRGNLEFKENLLYNGVSFSFKNKPKAVLADRLKATPLNVYFQTGSSEIILDQKQEKYFADLKKYIAQNPDEKIRISGHTDNKGNADANRNLGKRRAGLIQKFMIERGFNSKNLLVTSDGPDKPIATNDTPEGRAKNRRVEVRPN